MKKLEDKNFEVDQELTEPKDSSVKRSGKRKKVKSYKKTNFNELDMGETDSDSECDEDDIEGISITEDDEMKIRSLVKSDETVIEESLMFDH